MENKLLPCPFCGGEAETIVAKKFIMEPLWTTEAKQPDEYNCWVECKKCHTVCGAVEYSTPDEATASWNRRSASANPPLTCEGCVYDDPDAEWNEVCFECKRMTHAEDMYTKKPEKEALAE